MSEDTTRVIRKEDAGVAIELKSVHEENDFVKMDFSEVRLLSNGWAECRKPDDEEDRVNFFPPERIHNIIVYDEETDETVTDFGTSAR
jgi:hypothetical protein